MSQLVDKKCTACGAGPLLRNFDGTYECHNDACPKLVAKRQRETDLQRARGCGALIGGVIGLAIHTAIFVGAVVLVVRCCT